MANTFFKFKQFTVQQDKCAMKVCTDSCLFGAWAAKKMVEGNPVERIMDIGTGTGLLSLMAAQETGATIDAVEIDPAAASQAAQNFLSSPWTDRLNVLNIPVDEHGEKKYDIIICNPPFFENDLRSPHQEVNTARHESGLTLTGLIQAVDKHLAPEGKAMILIPPHRLEKLETIAKKSGLYMNDKLFVRQSIVNDCFRVFVLFSRKIDIEKFEDLSIYDENRNYSDEFRDLLKEYYLNL